MAMKLILERDHQGTALTLDTPIEHKKHTIKGEVKLGTTYPKAGMWINTGKSYPYRSIKRGGKPADDPIITI